MKRKIVMPKDDEKMYKLVPEGERFLQVVDIHREEERAVIIKCEDIETGFSLLYKVDLEGEYLWVTKLFLKCISEPHNGDIEIDTEAWIGRRFYAEVKHNGNYANVKKLIYKEVQQVELTTKKEVKKEIAWDE